MTAFHDFIKAAASYYGLPENQLTEGCTLDTSNGDLEVVLRIAMTVQDVEGVAKRMGIMRVEAEVDEAVARKKAQQGSKTALSREQVRAEFNALPTHVKSAYGSFGRFLAAREELEVSRALAATTITTTPEPVQTPRYVWVRGSLLTEQQKAGAIGVEGNEYAMDPDDLTEDQRAMGRVQQ